MIILFSILFIVIVFAQIIYANKLGNTEFHLLFISCASRILMLLLYEFDIISLVDAGGDTEGFKLEAVYLFKQYDVLDLMQFWELQGENGTFPIILALIYKIFLPEYIIISLINILLFNSVIIQTAKILNFFRLNKRHKFFLLLLISFFPLLLSYSVIVLREMFFIFCISLFSFEILNYYKNGKTRANYLLMFFYSALAVILHPGMVLFFVSTLFVFLKPRRLINWKYFLLIFLLYYSISMIINAGYGGGYFNFLYSGDNIETSLLNRASAFRESSIFRYDKLYQANLFYNIFVALPVDFYYFLISPIPLPFSNIFFYGLWRYPAGLLCLIILWRLLFKQIYDTNLLKIFLFVLLTASLPFVLGSSDVLQAVRHKMKFFPIFIILLALTYEKAPNNARD